MGYSYSYSYSDTDAAAALGGAFVVVYIIAIIIGIIALVAMWKLFSKAGKPGWVAIVPIYNAYVLFDILYGKGIKFLLMLVPVLNVAVDVAMVIRLAQVYGKGVGFGIAMLFFPYICMPMLAFGKSEYQGSIDAFI